MEYMPLDLSRLKRYSVTERMSKASVDLAGKPHTKGGGFRSFMDSLPDYLAVKGLKAAVRAIVSARKNNRPVILGMGAHPIKVGLSPLIRDLMQKGIITALATNGAAIIHDFEISFIGQTSEDVEKELITGAFGMALETGQRVNEAINRGVERGSGIGRSMGEYIASSDFPHKGQSIFGQAFSLNIPASVHVAMGCDIIHMHPEADGARIGEGSLRDFRLLTSVVADLEGGVYLNLGSAVILPEVFLKALTSVRNLGHRVEDFTTVNMDFVQHYRPKENVLRRPTLMKGRAVALTGHHEIMFPLLHAMVMEEM
ncbi:MAG: hypothetical protein HGA78_00450 [Nitrospirales bacterium]|nr:hypothetical protein [Nitrospirales bacterium]